MTYALLQRHQPVALSGTRILCQTPDVPAPPFVTGAATSESTLRTLRVVLAETLNDPRMDGIRSNLLLGSVEVLPLDAYMPIVAIENSAIALGYNEMPAATPDRRELVAG